MGKKYVKERTYQARMHGRKIKKNWKKSKKKKKLEHFNLVNIGGSKQGWREVWGSIKMTTFGLFSSLERGLPTQYKLLVGSGASANWGGEGDGIGPRQG